MASIKKRGQNSWLVTVSNGYDSAGRKIIKTKTFKKPPEMTDKQWEKELPKLALEFERQVEKGTVLDGNVTLKEFVDRWMKEYAEKQLEPKTLESYKYELDSKIIPALGHVRLDKLTPVHILSFLNNLLEDGVRQDGKQIPYSNRVIKYQHQILSSILQTAVYWQTLESNPCSRVKCPKRDVVDNKQKFFDENQAAIFLEAVKDEPLKWQVMVNLALLAGLRKGELLALTWNDINLEEGWLTVNKAISATKELGTFVKSPKTESSVRTLAMPKTLVALLKKYKAWQNEQKLKCGNLWDKNWETTPWLFTTWNGKVMNYYSPHGWFRKFIRRYNEKVRNDESIPENEKSSYLLPEISFHGLRHTSATLLIGEKVDIRTVSARLGHNQVSTTLNIYAHSLKAADRKAADSLENLLTKKNKPNIKQA
ncbi:MAG: site-specific integrase [Tepidanaerobacteraceae bacterium]|jgi:integrase|nr:site-specific integrase [Tepidanaerobacteraceae bacterium]